MSPSYSLRNTPRTVPAGGAAVLVVCDPPNAEKLQARSIPIWLGGSDDAAFERAARLADGFIFFGGGAHAIDAWKRLRDRVSSLGRPPEDFGADYVALPRGGVDDLTAEVDAWRAAGDTHVSVVTMGLGLDSADAHLDYLASVADALSLS